MKDLIHNNSFILMEGAIVEQLQRNNTINLHPILVNAPLIYDKIGRQELKKLYQAYIEVAAIADLPFLMCTPTWRTN